MKVVIAVRLSGAVTSRKMITSISKGILKANGPNTLPEFDGHVTLIEDWARGIL